MNIQLLKYLQKTKGLARRDFEILVKQGLIKVNDEVVTSMNHEINVGDNLKISMPKGQTYEETIKQMNSYRPVIVAFNKPKGYTVSKEDKFNKTIYELLPESWKKDFYYIGRLDKESHGLLLLTNEPKLVDYYESPKNKILKIYEVQIDKPYRSRDVIKAKRGLLVDQDGNKIEQNDFNKPIGTEELSFYDVQYLPDRGVHMLRILLDEGKKRHIRRLLAALGYKVKDLKRIKVGKFELGTVKPGSYKIYKA